MATQEQFTPILVSTTIPENMLWDDINLDLAQSEIITKTIVNEFNAGDLDKAIIYADLLVRRANNIARRLRGQQRKQAIRLAKSTGEVGVK